MRHEAPQWMRAISSEEQCSSDVFPAGKERYFRYLSEGSTLENPFPTSKENQEQFTQEDYDSIEMKEYQDPGNGTKTDYKNPNIGHKLHLNVSPTNVSEVSFYLKRQGYHHKYLSGGDPAEGKVFTVYIGSFALANRCAKEISQDISPFLARPVDVSEIEYAPNVIGRFSPGQELNLARYGSQHNRGIPLTQEAAAILLYKKDTPIDAEFTRAYALLSHHYGAYFHG